MARSNTANSGTSYYDLVFQLVSDDGVTQVVRAVIYLTSRNVTDTTNNLSVGGNYSRSGTLGLGGVYNNAAVWSQDIAVQRSVGANYNISVSASWSSVEYWGATLSASESYTVPARYEAPSAPGTSADSITPTSARIVVTASTYAGGATIDAYEAYVMTNNAWPGQGGNVVASASGGTFTANNLLPSTTYYYTARAHNSAGIWSGWTAMKAFTTLPAGYVRNAGVWKNAIPYVKVSGVWKMATPYVKVAGVWKLA
jgi:Fibronectin type III domain.